MQYSRTARGGKAAVFFCLVCLHAACTPEEQEYERVPLANASDDPAEQPDINVDVEAVLAPCGDDCAVTMPPITDMGVAGLERDEPPALLVRYHGVVRHYEDPNESRLVLAAWPDGQIVWAEDKLRGGPLYRLGRVPRSLLARVIVEAASDRRLDHPAVQKYALPDDAGRPHSVIAICSGDHCLQRRADFEAAETSQSVVLPDPHRLEDLDGRDVHDLLAQQPEDYRRFRRTWTNARHHIIFSLVRAAEFTDHLPYP